MEYRQTVSDWCRFRSHIREARSTDAVRSEAALTFRDRHSDELCYSTCEAGGVLARAERVVHQILPEPFFLHHERTSGHDQLRRPVAIAANARGDIFVSEAEGSVVLMAITG